MIGEQIGNFRIVGRLGMGGMGEVYLAEQETIRTRVAIKMLLPHISSAKEHVQRFFNEAIAASKIQHAGIVKIFDVGFHREGRAYLVMEYLDGETLAARIRRSQRMPMTQLGDVGRQISSVLDAVHRAGITHRDLKPDNIFLVPDAELASGERVKILDFGIAKLTGPSGGMTSTSVGSMGTPAYMSPEQWRNSAKVDWRADAYSLGCLAFEMATGGPPFPAESIGEACTKHLTEEPPRLANIMTVPPALDALVAQLLAKTPEQRPASMKAIGATFEMIGSQDAFASTVPQPVRFPSTPMGHDTTLGGAVGARTPTGRSSSKTGVLVVALLGVAVLGASAAVIATRDSGETTGAAMAPSDATMVVTSIETPDAAMLSSPPPPSPPIEAPPLDAGVALAEATPAPIAKPSATAIVKRPRSKDVAGDTSDRPSAAPIVKGSVEKSPASGCDEVSCVLSNYDGACCARYKKIGKTGGDETRVERDVLPESLDRTMISTVMARLKSRVMACGDKSSAKGQVRISVKVGPDGSVGSVSVGSAPDEALGNCVAAAVRGARFARTQTGGSFSYPYVF